ncbi:MAG: MOSC domain-containing protein [Pyrinomonadaceae bacterium]
MNISEINIYPIKSLKGISLDAATVEERGLRHDRRWMLTTPDGMFFTQREFPKMATLSVWIEEDGSGLGVAADRFGDVFVPIKPDTGNKQQVTIWQSVCEGEVYGGALNEWFSDVIETKCQLVYMPDDSRRSVNPRFDRGSEVVSFADGYPLMVLSEASLEDLNGRLAANTNLPPRHRSHHPVTEAVPPLLGQEGSQNEQGGELFEPLPMNRFRPNIVVSGSEAYAEDDWKSIRIGDAEFRSTKPCERCVITTVDQAKGDFAGKEPLKTLAAYRMAQTVMPDRLAELGFSENVVLFGQNLIAETTGANIRVGDECQIISTF